LLIDVAIPGERSRTSHGFRGEGCRAHSWRISALFYWYCSEPRRRLSWAGCTIFQRPALCVQR
jgi:hypothetical protein